MIPVAVKLIYQMFAKQLSWMVLHARSDTASYPHTVGYPDDVAQRRQPLPDRRDLFGLVDLLVAVRVATHRDHDGGLDPGEAVDHAVRSELGRAGGTDRAQRRA